jgi:AraC family transcriptional regulator
VATSTYLLETPRLAVGEFRCPPGDPAWREPNWIGDEPHAVFPLTAVIIDPDGAVPVLTTPNHAVFYEGGQLYRRRLESEAGDHCIFVRLEPRTFERLTRGGWEAAHGPADRRTFLERHLLVRRLRAGTIRKREAETAALALVRRALVTAAAPRARRNPTVTAHRELAERAKALIARSFTERLSLAGLGQRLRTSPFHLARVFRAETGFSVDGYVRSLRLRDALERLPSHDDGLTALALELGFSSHSHFTEAFRREFGLAPSAFR